MEVEALEQYRNRSGGGSGCIYDAARCLFTGWQLKLTGSFRIITSPPFDILYYHKDIGPSKAVSPYLMLVNAHVLVLVALDDHMQ